MESHGVASTLFWFILFSAVFPSCWQCPCHRDGLRECMLQRRPLFDKNSDDRLVQTAYGEEAVIHLRDTGVFEQDWRWAWAQFAAATSRGSSLVRPFGNVGAPQTHLFFYYAVDFRERIPLVGQSLWAIMRDRYASAVQSSLPEVWEGIGFCLTSESLKRRLD